MVHRLVKRLISGALALTLVFSINGFAAVVTDNDGSAFITKAEFDSLKNSFQTQIDSYNQAIDSKIDGAIAAYLAGIRIAKTINYETLVENYDEIRWMSDFQWKLKGKKWTSKTATSTIPEKYTHPVFENYRNVRGSAAYIFDTLGDGYTSSSTNFKGARQSQTGITQIHGVNELSAQTAPTNDQWTSPVLYLPLRWDNTEREYFFKDQGLRQELCFSNSIHTVPHIPGTHQSGGAGYWQVGYLRTGYPAANGIAIKAPGTGEYFAYWIDIYLPYTGTWYGKSSVTPKNSAVGIPQYTNTLDIDYGITNTTMPEAYGPYAYPQYWQMSPSAAQYQADNANLQYAMIATNSNCSINVCRTKEGYPIVNSMEYDWDGAVSAGVKYKFNPVWWDGPVNGNIMTNNVVDLSATAWELKWPLFPKENLYDLSNGRFKRKDDEKFLKVGDGLPLVKKATGDQQVHVRFNYTKENAEVGGAAPSNQKIYVSFKKSTYRNNIDDYAQGYKGGSLNLVLVKDYQVNDGNVDFTLDLQDGEGLWLAVKPEEKGGVYAKIHNLSVVGSAN